MADCNAFSLPCLVNFFDLEKECVRENLTLAESTNRFMLLTTFRKLGIARSQKVIKECEYTVNVPVNISK
jgi:hypothetical protein